MHVWLVEINANPSLNVYSDTLLPNGDIEQNLSELDKYVKTMLMSDTLRIITMPQEIVHNYSEVGCLKKILPVKNDLEELYMYSHFEKLFEFLSGNKNYDFLTLQQFLRLSRIQGLLLPKSEYEAVYKSVVVSSDSSQMDLNCFFEAIEELAGKVFANKDPYDNLLRVITIVNEYLQKPEHS